MGSVMSATRWPVRVVWANCVASGPQQPPRHRGTYLSLPSTLELSLPSALETFSTELTTRVATSQTVVI